MQRIGDKTQKSIRRHRKGISAVAVLLLGSIALGGCRTSPQQREANGWSAADAEYLAEIEFTVRSLNGLGLDKDPTDAVQILEDLSNRGNSTAQVVLGEAYMSGNNLPRDPQVGVKLLRQAADRGAVRAKVDLAYAYVFGIGLDKDPAQGHALVKRAADEGNPAAFAVMGEFLFFGWDGTKDETAAVEWFRKAADKGSSLAMRRLGEAYQGGRGRPADKVVAYAWFSLSASTAQSSSERTAGLKARDDLALLLLPDELERGRKLADNWKPGQDLERASIAIEGRDSGAPAPQKPVETVSAEIRTGASAADTPVVFDKVNQDIEVDNDGGYSRVTHIEVQAHNDSAAHRLAQYPVFFDATMQELDVIEAYTAKADGRKLPVDPAAIQIQLASGTPDVPMFNGQRQKVILFPSVEAGDRVVLTVRLHSKPYIPGFYTYSWAFDRTTAQNDVRVTISAPMALMVETHGLTASQRQENGRHVYEWRFSNRNPLAEDRMAVSPYDRNPRIFASSFQNYQQLGKAYASLSDDKIVVTPAVQKLADEITAGISGRREQAAAIHDWVSRHIRYVLVQLGNDGAMVPHPVETILANGYGDCKDHSVLYSSLLKAKGIPSQIVLLNADNGYSLPSPPTFGLLNHAITWLPEFNLYDDTTLGVAPLGGLSFAEYGKPAVHVSATSPQVRRTPTLLANAAESVLRTTMRLNTDGSIEGDSEASGTGPFAVGLRQVALALQAQGLEQTAKQYLKSHGIEGTGKFEVEAPYSSGAGYRITGHFRATARSDLVAGNSFSLPYGLAVGWRPGEDLLGPIDLLDTPGIEVTPCYRGREIADLVLELPPGKKLREQPKTVEISNATLSYKSVWSIDGRTVRLHRELISAAEGPICVGETRRLAAKALNDIRIDSHAAVSLVDE